MEKATGVDPKGGEACGNSHLGETAHQQGQGSHLQSCSPSIPPPEASKSTARKKKKKESSTNLQRCIPKILLQQFAARSFLHHGCFPSGLLETGFVPLSSSSSLKAGSFQHKVFQRKEKSTLTVAECLEAILGHAGFATSSAAHTCFFHLHVEDAHSQF